jgi:hypothetical protein
MTSRTTYPTDRPTVPDDDFGERAGGYFMGQARGQFASVRPSF